MIASFTNSVLFLETRSVFFFLSVFPPTASLHYEAQLCITNVLSGFLGKWSIDAARGHFDRIIHFPLVSARVHAVGRLLSFSQFWRMKFWFSV